MVRKQRQPSAHKVTPISELERLTTSETGVVPADSPVRVASPRDEGCDCPSKTVTERTRDGQTILRCPECGIIHTVVSRGQRLAPGTFCRWCGREDLTAPSGVCADRSCHPGRKKQRSAEGFPVVCSKCGQLQRGRVVALGPHGECQSCYDEEQA
jgi:hypothetical protein